MTKMAYSHVGYIASLRHLAFLCKDWVGDCSITRYMRVYIGSKCSQSPFPNVHVIYMVTQTEYDLYICIKYPE